jgi:ABC-type transport system substrate-binding protein
VLILDFLSSPQGAQISPKSLKEAKNLKAGGPELAGTGPFVLDRYTPGQEVHFTKNPAYNWAPAGAGHSGPAYLDQVTYRFLKESSVRVGALTSGQAQVIEGVPATDESLISANPGLGLRRGLNSGSAYSYYFNTAHAPFDDLRVRQAFREALDVPAVLAGVYRNTASRAWSVVPLGGRSGSAVQSSCAQRRPKRVGGRTNLTGSRHALKRTMNESSAIGSPSAVSVGISAPFRKAPSANASPLVQSAWFIRRPSGRNHQASGAPEPRCPSPVRNADRRKTGCSARRRRSRRVNSRRPCAPAPTSQSTHDTSLSWQ